MKMKVDREYKPGDRNKQVRMDLMSEHWLPGSIVVGSDIELRGWWLAVLRGARRASVQGLSLTGNVSDWIRA